MVVRVRGVIEVGNVQHCRNFSQVLGVMAVVREMLNTVPVGGHQLECIARGRLGMGEAPRCQDCQADNFRVLVAPPAHFANR